MQTRPLSANKQQRCFVGTGSSQDSYPAILWFFLLMLRLSQMIVPNSTAKNELPTTPLERGIPTDDARRV
jgi:hypothetical protein